jgi:ABC-type glycerol-3-phosphate transport system substrate-binding protein
VALVFTGHRLALPQPTPHVLRFAHTFTTESERAIIDDAVAEFEKTHPGLRIEQIISNSETYNTIGWRLQFQGRKQPDIYFHWQGFKANHCIERGWAMDLAPYLSPGFVEQFVPSALRRQNQGLYFLPQSIDLSALVWYNRDLFAARGLTPPTTLRAWVELCSQLRQERVLPLAQGNRDLWPMGNFAAELLGQTLGPEASARLFQPKRALDPTEIRGLKPLLDLREAGAFDLPGVLEPGAIGALGDIDAKVFFLSGKSAQHILGSWFVADVQDARNKNELKFSVGLFPVPANDGETDAITAVSTGYLVNPATKNAQAAVAFLELLLSRKHQSAFAKLGNLSLRRDALEFTSDPLAQQMLKIVATTPVRVPPPDTGYPPEQAAVFYELVGKLLTGRLEWNQLPQYWSKEKADLARKGL